MHAYIQVKVLEEDEHLLLANQDDYTDFETPEQTKISKIFQGLDNRGGPNVRLTKRKSKAQKNKRKKREQELRMEARRQMIEDVEKQKDIDWVEAVEDDVDAEEEGDETYEIDGDEVDGNEIDGDEVDADSEFDSETENRITSKGKKSAGGEKREKTFQPRQVVWDGDLSLEEFTRQMMGLPPLEKTDDVEDEVEERKYALVADLDVDGQVCLYV
jgi:hypothetical protein